VDETYPGGEWRSKKKIHQGSGNHAKKRNEKTACIRQPYRNGQVLAEGVETVEAEILYILILNKMEKGSGGSITDRRAAERNRIAF